jgi:hypothetical protein
MIVQPRVLVFIVIDLARDVVFRGYIKVNVASDSIEGRVFQYDALVII